MYIIRENSKGGRSVYYEDNIRRIVTIIFWSLWISLIAFILTQPFKEISDGDTTFSKLANFIPIFIFILFIFIGIWLYSKELKMDKAKNFKKSGGGIIKKLRITGIKTYASRGRVRYFYYAVAEDGNTIYCSNAYEKGFVGGTSVDDLDKLYKKYGYNYDKNETHKKDVLNEIDKRKTEKEYKIKNGGLLKKLVSKGGELFSKDEKEIVKKGYQSPYWEVNGHKISVGDTVDVYIDPDDEKNYWMDIDFLFDK